MKPEAIVTKVLPSSELYVVDHLQSLVFSTTQKQTQYTLVVPETGSYVFLTQHMPWEFVASHLTSASGNIIYPTESRNYEVAETSEGQETSHCSHGFR